MAEESATPQGTDSPQSIEQAFEGMLSPQPRETPSEDNAVEEGADTPVEEASDVESEASAEDTQDEAEPSERSVIEPPLSMSEADRSEFAKLSPEVQRWVAARERDRESVLSRSNRELAESKKQYATFAQQLAQERQRITDYVVPIVQQLSAELQSEEAQLTQLLVEGNVEEWARRKSALETRASRLQQMQAEKARMDEQAKRDREFQIQERVKAESQALLEHIPTWKDSKTAEAERGQIRDYLLGRGFATSDVERIIDHRLVRIARDAMLYDKLVKSRPQVEKKVTGKPPAVKPGTQRPKPDARQSGYAAGMKAARQNGKDNDALAQVFRALI